jgi:hypothetical protein
VIRMNLDADAKRLDLVVQPVCRLRRQVLHW